MKKIIRQKIEKAFSEFNKIAKRDGYRVEFVRVTEINEENEFVAVEFKEIHKKHFFSKEKTYLNNGSIWSHSDGSFSLEF